MIGLFDVNTHNSRMAKYWVAKEMADNIVSELGVEEMPEKENGLWWNAIYKITWETLLISYLTQVLKKEWFR